MKKAIISFITFFLFTTISFGYSPTENDISVLNKVYGKLDIIYVKAPETVEKLGKQINGIKSNYISNERLYYILSELEDYISSKEEKEVPAVINIIQPTPKAVDILEEAPHSPVTPTVPIDTSKTKPIFTGKSKSYFDPNDTSYLDMGFNCNKGKYCTRMESCDEVKYYFYVCKAGSFDRDKDGIPCENICGTE